MADWCVYVKRTMSFIGSFALNRWKVNWLCFVNGALSYTCSSLFHGRSSMGNGQVHYCDWIRCRLRNCNRNRCKEMVCEWCFLSCCSYNVNGCVLILLALQLFIDHGSPFVQVKVPVTDTMNMIGRLPIKIEALEKRLRWRAADRRVVGGGGKKSVEDGNANYKIINGLLGEMRFGGWWLRVDSIKYREDNRSRRKRDSQWLIIKSS